MTLSADDLRAALDDAAHGPLDATSTARLTGVRSRVVRHRRRRAAAAGTVSVLAVAAVVTGVALGGGRAPDAVPSRPAPTPTATDGALVLPTLYGPRDVAAQVSGEGDETPARLISWPARASGLVLGCNAPGDQPVTVHLRTATQDITTSVGCTPDGRDAGRFEPQVVDLPPAARRLTAGEQVELQASLGAGPGTRFVAGVLTGRDLVDLSKLRKSPKGYGYQTSAGIGSGWVYLDQAPGGPKPSTAGVVSGFQLFTEGKRALRLVVHCGGRQQLAVRLDGAPDQTVECPAGVRTTQTLDLTPPSVQQQHLTVNGGDGDPGALAEIGVYAR